MTAPAPNRWRKNLTRLAICTGLGLTAAGLGGLWYLRYFINTELTPQVQRELSKQLARPVNLGAVQKATLGVLQIGQSNIPSTDTAQDTYTINQVDIQLDWWRYLQVGKVGVKIKASGVTAFIPQVPEPVIPPPDQPPATIPLPTVVIEPPDLVELQGLTIANGQVTIKGGVDGKLVTIGDIQGEAQLDLEDTSRQSLALTTTGRLGTGTLHISGSYLLTKGSGEVRLQLQAIPTRPLQSVLVGVPVLPQAGTLSGDVQLVFGDNGVIKSLQGFASVQDISLQVGLPQPITGITGRLEVDGLTLTISQLEAKIGAIPATLKGTIGLEKGDLDVTLQTKLTPIKDILASTGLQPGITIDGAIQLQATAKGTTARPQITAQLVSDQTLLIDRVALANFQGKFSTRLVGETTVLGIDRLETILQGGGKLQGKGQVSDRGWDVQLNLEGVNGEAIAQLYETQLPIRVGDISGELTVEGQLANPEIRGEISAPNAEYPAQISATLFNNQAVIRRARVNFPQYGGRAELQGTYELNTGKWSAQVVGNGFPVNLLLTEEQGTLNLQADLTSPRGSFQLQDITGTISAELPQGLSTFPEPINLQGNWTGTALVGSARVGNLLTLDGRVGITFPEGITDLDVQVNAPAIALRRLAVLVPRLSQNAQGLLSFSGKLVGKPESLAIDGRLKLENVNLADLSAVANLPFLPKQGALFFNGQVNGTLPTPRLIGSWRISNAVLDSFRLAQLEFRGTVDPLGTQPTADGVLALENAQLNQVTIAQNLRGELSYRGDRGLLVNLESVQDKERLVLELDENFLLQGLDAQLLRGALLARKVDEQVAVNIQDLPLNLFSERLSGRLFSALTVDLRQNWRTTGDISIDQPRFGRAILDRVAVQVDYRDNQLRLTNGHLRFPDQAGSYTFQLTYNPNADVPIQGAVQVEAGTIQNLTTALQWREFSDIARGLDLVKISARAVAPLQSLLSRDSLYASIQYLAQLDARQEQQEQAIGVNALFPPLSEFKGILSGQINFSTDRNFAPTVVFNVTARQLEYGKFAFDTFQTQGKFTPDSIVIDRLRLGTPESFAEIRDTQLATSLLTKGISLETLTELASREQRAVIQLSNFPIETLRPFPFYQALPFDVSGNVNGQAQISGTLFNPQAKGKLSLANPTVNRRPLELVEGEFNFQNFQFNFQAKALVSGKEPLTAKGSVAVLGGAIDVQVAVKNEGLAFLNIFEQPLRWLSGKGSASLEIRGMIANPQVEGKVKLEDTSLAVLGLNEPLQAVQGELAFNRDRIDTNLRAIFSEGNFTATGAIALFDPQLIRENPLTIDAQRFSLNIRDLSAQQASGQVVVQGTVFNPVLTGAITLADGRLLLPEENRVEPPPLNVGFNNLQVSLQNMQITRPPVFNFLAEGTITVNGTAQQILPSGRVNFSRGQFNAVSARFRLDRSFDNYAEFIPSQGLDPNLNVRVTGSLAELTRVPIITDPVLGALSPRDIPVSTQGAQRTLRVQATVEGTASNPNIRLTSSPPRTQSELVALIGGGALPQTTDTDASTAFINLAGGGILNLLQDVLGEVLSVAEFNLNPVTTNPRGSSSTNLGLAAEVAIDFSNSFSAAVRTIINDPNEPTDYSIRYRLDPTIIFRGNINSRGDRGASIEFETRF